VSQEIKREKKKKREWTQENKGFKKVSKCSCVWDMG
jgi:hypothetical protein